jgi:hypothetical protein
MRDVRTIMRRFLMLWLACACAVASLAEAGPKKKGPPLDPFGACDLQVRADLREGGTWLIPRDIRLDEGRLILTVTFSTEKSIRSVPKSLYGNTDVEKRRQLRGYLEEMKAAIDAATKESAWFVVASKRTLPPHLRSPEGEDASPWYGLLLADIGGQCRSVAMFRNVQPDQLPPEVQRDLKE